MKIDYKKIFWGILIVFGLWLFFNHIRDRANNGFYGDQTHFLIMTQSIVQDDDLNVKNQYDNGDYWEYYVDPGFKPLDPHLPKYKFNEHSPTWYSLHNPGLSIALAPAYFLAGTDGAVATIIALDMITLALVYLWVFQISKSKAGALWAVIILLSSPFFIGQIGYIFTDLPILGIILLALILFFRKNKKWWHYLFLSILLGASVWLHIKVVLIMATIGILSLTEIIKNKQDKSKFAKLIAMIGPSLILIGLFEIKLYEWYGVIWPTSSFAGDQMLKMNPIVSLGAYLFDRNQGLLAVNPGWWVVPSGLTVWYFDKKQEIRNKKQENFSTKNQYTRFDGRKQIVYLVLILGPTFLMQLTFDDWCGGYSPAGRYIISMVPVFLPAASYLWQSLRSWWLKLIIILPIAWQAGYVFFMIYYRSIWSLCGQRNQLFLAIENKTGLAMDSIWPVFNGKLDLVQNRWELGGFIAVLFFLFVVGWVVVTKMSNK